MSGVEMSDLQNLKIRDATLEDAKELLEVHIRSIREICSDDYTDEQISAWSDPKTDESYHEPISKGCFWVAEFDGKIVGIVTKQIAVLGIGCNTSSKTSI